MYSANLVQLVCPGEQRVEAGDLEEHATSTPLVHFRAVVTVRQQALWRAVPPRRDILRIRLTCDACGKLAGEDVLKFNASVWCERKELEGVGSITAWSPMRFSSVLANAT